ncbi:MAG: FCD domain-containing protein [Boseongicola sp.]|nr:FCD domain-containing protein [Boseongicola sp.]
MRAQLEAHAVEIAAVRTPELGDRLLAVNDAMSTAIAQDETAEFVAINDEFHKAIVEAGQNPVLATMWGQLEIRARTAVNVSGHSGDLSEAISEHRAIATAVLESDPERASQLLQKHIKLTVEGRD